MNLDTTTDGVFTSPELIEFFLPVGPAGLVYFIELPLIR